MAIQHNEAPRKVDTLILKGSLIDKHLREASRRGGDMCTQGQKNTEELHTGEMK